MEHRAWRKVRFAYPPDVPTMLASEEKRYLYWLTRSVWSGRGLVVEIGPWLGGSTVCLAAGMRASGHDARGMLHVVDNFLWREFMARRVALPIAPGDSFEMHFLKNVQSWKDMVVPHARTLPDETVAGDAEAASKRFAAGREVAEFSGIPGDEPVEILFIDGAKSWRGMRHLLRVLAPRLQTGALLVCQDFKYWGTYWVPMMMARLADHVAPVHDVRGGTTVAFELASPLPSETISTLEDHVAGVPTEDGLRLIDRAVQWLRDDGDVLGAANVSLARVSFLSHQGRVEDAVREFVRIQESWPAPFDVSQVLLAGQYLREEKRRTVPHPFPIRLGHQWLKLKGAWTKRFGKE